MSETNNSFRTEIGHGNTSEDAGIEGVEEQVNSQPAISNVGTDSNGQGPTEDVPHSPTDLTRNRSKSNADSTSGGLLPRSQRVWELDRHASECRRCHRRFNFLIRRHHCRRCGQIVCDKCSSHRIRLPAEEIIEDPMIASSQYPFLATQTQRVCDSCYREPIRRSSESYHKKRRSFILGREMQRSNSSQSLMIDCPVCGTSFLSMQKGDQEKHLQRCLNVGSPPVQLPRYIVYELPGDSAQIGEECPICFDEFTKGIKTKYCEIAQNEQ
ncbi:hypothetical protein CU098_006300 [Rhizopus stolonifer]|uniref:FYVE-type domain-containing protein n=1 Tax=Rhizopus stolonifer TaxID=4846 RepID=A0A367KCS6_RHIST|nr:hypothetical protein CU098_006300 [Rhizopus stolonifer]